MARGANETDLRRVGLHPRFWYPLARSADVRRERTHLCTFAGDPIVVARTADGNVFALDDRCAHRQFPLHKGVVSGDVLKCAYHAWSYRHDGSVAAVPYLPKHACRPHGVRAYACREAHGYVFVFTGAREDAELVPFPALPQLADPRRRTIHFFRQVGCHYSFMHENLMDMNHQFLHRGVMGTIRPALLGWDEGEDWVEVRYLFRRAGGKAKPGAGLMLAGGKRDTDAPAGDVMTIRTQYPYQLLSVRRGGAAEPAFDLWVVYVPSDEAQRTHVSVGMLSIAKPKPGFLIHLAWPFIRRFTEAVFAEDRMAVEAEQRAYDLQQGDRNQEINPVILALRRMLIRNGVAEAPTAAPRALVEDLAPRA